MRVLMTADCVGGVWSYATTLCRALAPHGVHVTLAATGRALSTAQRQEAARLENVTLVSRPYRCEWMADPWDDVQAAGDWLESLAREARVDLVHLNDFAHGGREFGGRPRMLVAHSCVHSWYAAVRGAEPGPEWRRYADAVAAGLAGADLVVAPSAAMLSALRRHHGWRGDGHVIHNALPLDTAIPAESVGGRREAFILCAGRLWDEAKNVSALAGAADGLSWPVRLAGETEHPDGGALRPTNVDLLGPLPHAELMRLMGVAGIYALPARYEPFGLSILEAAQGGCALVLGDIDSLREVWGEAALYVGPDDVPALRAALSRLIADAPLRHRLMKLARQRAERYTPERMAKAYIDAYRDLHASAFRRSAE